MQIRFNPFVGEIYDFFNMLYCVNNYDDIKVKLEEYDIEINKDYQKFLFEFIEDDTLDKEKISLYFNKESELADVFISDDEIMRCSGLEQSFNFIANLSGTAIKERLVKKLIHSKGDKSDKEKIEKEAIKISENEESIIKIVKSLDMDSAVKWDLFCFIQEPERYRDEYLAFMRELAPRFHELYGTNKKVIAEFNSYIEGNLKRKGLEFINKITRCFIKYDTFSEIHITTTYINYYSLLLYEIADEACNMYIGIGAEEVLEKIAGREGDKLQRNINVYKNFSDMTRFEILKLMNEEDEYCSKDIAEKLGITGATVSYHMNYLLSANLIAIQRQNKKNYYVLNKEVIREAIDFIRKEFDI